MPIPSAPFVPLEQLTAAGQAILLLDSRYAGRPPMEPDFAADIHLELRRPDPAKPCRELLAHAGFADTPSRLRFELTADGTDLTVLPDPLPVVPPQWPQVLHILDSAPRPLTRAEILARWPSGTDRPDPGTLWRWLRAACGRGELTRIGSGRHGDAYRYGLAGRQVVAPAATAGLVVCD